MKRISTICVLGAMGMLAQHAQAQSALGGMMAAPAQAASPMGIAPGPASAKDAKQRAYEAEQAARRGAPAPAPIQAGPVPAQNLGAPAQNASPQIATVVCKAPDLPEGVNFSYRLDYANFTVTTPAGAVRPVTMSAQEINWDDTGPDGTVKNTLQRYSGQLTQVKAAQTFTFSCQPG